jgi:NAD-dependent SIR2 family protein deacetylase
VIRFNEIIIGAEISVTADVEPFRGAGGVYNTNFGCLNAADLLHVRCLQVRIRPLPQSYDKS